MGLTASDLRVFVAVSRSVVVSPALRDVTSGSLGEDPPQEGARPRVADVKLGLACFVDLPWYAPSLVPERVLRGGLLPHHCTMHHGPPRRSPRRLRAGQVPMYDWVG